MSDPIAAAEAAGKARDIANRFETAVFLIAYGIAEKDGLYEADPHRYPYSQAFRHGMNILAALCAECSDDAEELLPTFNESDFIRNSAASDVREWTARWRDECREAVEGCRSIEIGPLASVDGDYFAATSECYEVLRFAENDLLGGHQERRVYEFLRAGTQEQYVYGRRMLIRHPLLTWNEYVRKDDQRVLPSVARRRGRGACQRQIRRGPARLHGAALQERYEGEPSRPAPSRRAGRGVYLGLGAHRQTVAIRPRK